MVSNITDESFEEEVIKHDKYVLVDFWAEWCGPCKQLAPVLDELSETVGDKVKIVKINIDENQQVPSDIGIRSIPTMILFKDGKQVDTKLGAVSKPVLQEWLESHTK